MPSMAMLNFHPEVDAALRDGRPVVALESSLIAHGASWQANVEASLELQDEVRANGAVPATCAIIDGRIAVGLSADETIRLAQLGPAAVKVSRRDLALMTTLGGTGVTTIAATIVIANLAGIRVFSAGGLGGVHRGASETFDISADLQALAQAPVAVVCAGIKSILDVGLTMEYLETVSVPVIGYGTDTLPGYYCRDSQFPVDARFDDPRQVAKAIEMSIALGLRNGMVIANPIPERYALPREQIERAIDQALVSARKDAITGKAITPYLIARLEALVGASRDASVQLGLNNARLASAIAVAGCAGTSQVSA